MTENQKLEDMGCDNVGSNCGELGEKGNERISVCDEVNGLQHSTTKSDSFVVDMERFSHIIDNKDLNSNSRITRNLSRKGSARTGEKKLTANDRDTNLLIATSPRATLHGVSTPEKPAVVALGPTDHPNIHHNHHQITISNATVSGGAVVAEPKLGGKRFSFRRSSHPTWIIDPRRILFIFATLSCMGTILLIYFTLSMSGKPNGDDNGVNLKSNF